MTREIKFRAWNDETQMMYMSHRRDGSDNPLWSYDAVLRRQDEETVHIMQFTGLHDTNGKAIYARDLLKHKFYSGPVIVSFENGCFISEDVDILSSSNEVIGNIHENPELLKG